MHNFLQLQVFVVSNLLQLITYFQKLTALLEGYSMELFQYFEPNFDHLRYTNHYMENNRTICVTGPVNLRALTISVKSSRAVTGMA